jgi:general secretion pathway protein L
MISQGFNWWSEGLAAGLAGLAKVIRRPRRFQLHRDAQSFLLHAVKESGPQAIIRIPDSPDGGLPADILQQTRGSVMEIVVPSAAILERRLDLPGESRPYVENVVRHQIETLFPWRAADVIHTTLIQDRQDGQLDVAVRATSQSAIAPALATATACGAGEVIIVGEGGGEQGAPAPRIPVAAGPAGQGRSDPSRTIARYAIAALLVLTVGMLGWTTYVGWSLEADIALLDRAIADRRAVLKRASDARSRAGGSSLEIKKQQSVVAVAALDALSSILPDDTYLTDLTLDAGRLRMSGLSGRATELVPLLEGSGNFKNASFYAPMTRMPGRSADRFSIEAVVVPRMGGAP